MKLACGSDEDKTELGRRPVEDADADQPAETVGGDFWVLCLRPSWAGGEVGLVLPLPGLPLGRYPLMVELLLAPEPEAPKLMRRTKGVLGPLLACPSSSSMALSSMDELVEMLPRRLPKVAGLVGEVPERPIVVTERRRPRGSAAPLLGPESEPFPLDGLRWKRLESAACVMELRR